MDFKSINTFLTEVEVELNLILTWWINNTVDKKNGGFYGKIDNQNQSVPNAEKGLVLNARILYIFSSAYGLTPNENYLSVAKRAFNYLIKKFLDPLHHGFYWSVNQEGQMLDSKKQVYGQAFTIYAFAEYYKITKDENALAIAQKTFELLEQHSFDQINTGYLEAFTQEWSLMEDLRLSNKDQNEKKTMNTHLHVIEAYANLFSVWPNDLLKIAIKKLLTNFEEQIIDKNSSHLNLFLSEQWEVKSNIVSYGHDIEASWLLLEAAEIIGEAIEINKFKELAIKLTNVAIEGLVKNGGLRYEFDNETSNHLNEFHWWPQAEAMVGFFNAGQLSGNLNYFQKSFQSWSFIKNYIKDDENGEWFWGVNSDYSPMLNEDKAGFWKCPYHNGRACIEIIKRINLLNNQKTSFI